MKPGFSWRMFLPDRANWLLSSARSFFLIVGIIALGYCAFALLDARVYQAYQGWRFRQAVDRAPHPGEPGTGEAKRARSEIAAVPGPEGSPLGRIEIGAIGLDAIILEGTGKVTLRRGVGHVAGTPRPGQPGNVALAAHRDTFFRALRNVRKDHEITLTTLNGSYRFTVDSTTVVQPQDVEVLDASDQDMLTLVTCYPFNFVGAAPSRFIVRARRTASPLASSRPMPLPQ